MRSRPGSTEHRRGTQNGMFTSTRGVTVSELTRGKDIWGRVRAIRPSGWSYPATVIVA